VKLGALELVRVDLPLVRPFRTSFGTQRTREILLVRALTDVGEGWGECAAHAEPFYNSEFVDAAEIVLERWMAPALFAVEGLCADDVRTLIDRVQGYAAAKASVEMAVLDSELRSVGQRLSDRLGGARDHVEVGVSVGITDTVDQLVELIGSYVADGYRRVKLKIEPGFDIEAVRAVRNAFPDLPLQVDANASYRSDAIDHLCRLDEFDLLMIEQPFAADDLDTHRALVDRVTTPICLDESILSLRSAELAVTSGACSIVNIKVGRVGGLLEAVRIHDMCRAHGVPVWCGGMLESGVGRAANVALASLPGFMFPGDISASDRYFARDVTEPFVLNESALTVPTGPGLGVSVGDATLSELGARRRLIRGPG
jgi:o-succinylbenzoate synthase